MVHTPTANLIAIPSDLWKAKGVSRRRNSARDSLAKHPLAINRIFAAYCVFGNIRI